MGGQGEREGEGGRETTLCIVMLRNVGLLFDRWRTSFYVMAVIIMEWVHKAWNACI